MMDTLQILAVHLLVVTAVFFGGEDLAIADEAASNSQGCAKKVEQMKLDFQSGMAKLEAKYRSSLAEAIALAESADVFLLEFDLSIASSMDKLPYDAFAPIGGFGVKSGKKREAFFPIVPYGLGTKVHRVRHLKTGDRYFIKLKNSISQMIRDIQAPTNGLEHLPTHGIVLYCEDGNEVVLQTSFCFKFDTTYVEYGGYPNYAKWHDIPGSDIQDILDGLMPRSDDYDARYEVLWQKLTGKKRRSSEKQKSQVNSK